MTDVEELKVPDSARLASVQALSEIRSPYVVGNEADELFVKAMREAVAWHADRSPFYGRLLKLRGFSAEDVQSIDDCSRIPLVHANFFKTHEVKSIPDEEVFLHLTSSGTTGQKSQIFLDEWSLKAGHRQVRWVYEAQGLVSTEPTNYLLYSYEPESSKTRMGTAFTANFMTTFAPLVRGAHALRAIGGGQHEFDVFGCIRTLKEYEEDGKPVRIIGFPSFLYFTLERMRAMKMPRIRLAPGSMTMFGGGWKGAADKSIPKAELYARIEEQLDIADQHCRDSYGSVEHSIPYIECRNHQFHVPVWARLWVRDANTLAPKDWGEPGFAHFVSAYRISAPVASILMGDLVAQHPGASCGCGIEAPYFEILGRAGTSKNRSCAIAASELLKGKRA